MGWWGMRRWRVDGYLSIMYIHSHCFDPPPHVMTPAHVWIDREGSEGERESGFVRFEGERVFISGLVEFWGCQK